MGVRYTARFLPQQWEEDEAMEVKPLGPTEWDVTEELYSWPDKKIQAVLDCENPYERDYLTYLDTAPEWVKDWDGPFEVYVTASEDDPECFGIAHALAQGLLDGLNSSYETLLEIKDEQIEAERARADRLQRKLDRIYSTFGLLEDQGNP
jgi:hypothetical protein